MRILSAISIGLASLALAACGGGGAGAPAQTALLTGKVTSVDGSTLSRSGITVESKNGGTYAVTGPDGSFTLEVPAGDPVVLHFEDPEHPDEPGNDRENADVPENDDVTPDGADIDGDEVTLGPLEEHEHCNVEVELEDGDIAECRIDHPDREGGDGVVFEAECRLKPVEGSSEPESIAEAELECTESCCVLEVEVGGVLFNERLTVVVECREVREELGVIEIVEHGGHFELEVCLEEGGPLPFEADSLRDLAGCWLLLVDGEGEVALVGCVPGERERDGEEEEGDRFAADARLEAVDGSSEPEAEGGAIVVCEGDCCVIVVEVGGIGTSELMPVVIECEDDRFELADMEIVEGQGRIEVEFCGDTPRPFGVESLKALGGCDLLVLDGAGAVALRGAFPGQRPE